MSYSSDTLMVNLQIDSKNVLVEKHTDGKLTTSNWQSECGIVYTYGTNKWQIIESMICMQI